MGGDCPTLFCSHEIPLGVLSSALGPPTKEGHGHIGVGSEDSREKKKASAMISLESLEKRKLWGDHIVVFLYLKEDCQKSWGGTLYKGM